MSDLGIAIVGTGMVARYHAQAIAAAPGARLLAVCRSSAGKTREAAEAFGVPCDESFEALLRRQDVDAVCLCTPSGLHAAHAIAAARAGKHVLVEKPMALSVADADAMISACRTAGVRLGVVLQRRTDPTFRELRTAIAAGELGDPVLGVATIPYYRSQDYYASAAWRGTWALDGGGALMNQGIHIVDLLLWFLGDVASVAAHAATLARSIEVEDCVTAALRFEGGALGSLAATTAATPGFPHRVEIYGTRGGVQIEGESVVRWHGAGSERKLPTSAGPSEAGAGASPTGIAPSGHARIVADFVAAVRDARDPLVTGEEGRRSLACVLAVYESARTGTPARPA
jgi:UDP-N-acetyl-2-amino-2-deoxyglucuronate dehydrogenase